MASLSSPATIGALPRTGRRSSRVDPHKIDEEDKSSGGIGRGIARVLDLDDAYDDEWEAGPAASSLSWRPSGSLRNSRVFAPETKKTQGAATADGFSPTERARAGRRAAAAAAAEVSFEMKCRRSRFPRRASSHHRGSPRKPYCFARRM